MINNAVSRWIAGRLFVKALAVMDARKPDFLIGGEDDPYMRRWWITPRNRWFNIYLHDFRHDDDDRALHDHPWWSMSILLSGAVLETHVVGGEHVKRIIPRGSIVFRSACFAHRLEVLSPGTLTIFVTGPRLREWGFHCPNGWRHWREFTAAGSPGEIGRGCGES